MSTNIPWKNALGPRKWGLLPPFPCQNWGECFVYWGMFYYLIEPRFFSAKERWQWARSADLQFHWLCSVLVTCGCHPTPQELLLKYTATRTIQHDKCHLVSCFVFMCFLLGGTLMLGGRLWNQNKAVLDKLNWATGEPKKWGVVWHFSYHRPGAKEKWHGSWLLFKRACCRWNRGWRSA